MVEREKEGYLKRVTEKEMDTERKRDMMQQIKTQQKQFLQYKALSAQQ